MEEVEPVPGAAVSDEEGSEASSASQPAPAQEKKKRKKSAAVDGDRQCPWRDQHQNTLCLLLVAFWQDSCQPTSCVEYRLPRQSW